MFTSPLSEANQESVTLNGVPAGALELLFGFAYTAEVAINKSNVQTLLAAANLLDMLAVRDACCEYLDKHMDEHNSLGIQIFAEMHDCRRLKDKARRFCLEHFGEIAEGEEFSSISQSQLIELISSDSLRVESEELVGELNVKQRLNVLLTGLQRRYSMAGGQSREPRD